MLQKKSLKLIKPDYKWVIAFLCTLVLSVGLGFCSSAKNIYIAPITSAFGFSRSAFTVNDSLRYITVAIATMFFGNLVEKFGTKKLIYSFRFGQRLRFDIVGLLPWRNSSWSGCILGVNHDGKHNYQ